MKADFKQIKGLAVGALSCYESEGAIYFDHYTEKTIEGFKSRNDFWHRGATCTTGVRLDFVTDASGVTVCTRGAGKYELLVDGLVQKSEIMKDEGVLEHKLGAGKSRVTVVLPSHSRGGIAALELEGATYVDRAQFSRKMLFIGDSITQGWNARFDSGSYAYITSRNLDADSVIQGVGGMVFHPELFDKNDFEPDIIVVAYGCNDFSQRQTLSELSEYAGGFLDKLCARYAGVKKIGVTPIWRQDEDKTRPMGSFSECRAVVEKSLTEHGFTVVDGYTLVPHMPEFFADDVHPNDLGFAEMAKNLTRQIENNL